MTAFFVDIRVLLIGFALGLVAGLAMATSSDPRTWVDGVLLALFCAAGAPLAYGELRASRPPARRDHGRLPDGTDVPALILPYRPIPGLVRLFGAVCLTAAAAVFALALTDAPGGIVGRVVVGLAGVYFGLVTVIRLRGRGSGPDSLAFTPSGLLARMAQASVYVPWVAVTGMTLRTLYGSPQFSIYVRDRDAVVRSGGAGPLNVLGSVFYGGDRVPISVRWLPLSPADVAHLAERFRAAAVAPRLDGTPVGLTEIPVGVALP